MKYLLLIMAYATLLWSIPATAETPATDNKIERPSDIVNLKKVAPKIYVEMMYNTQNNFVGEKINGYKKDICYLQKDAALALKAASEDIRPFGFVLKVFDCYRPQKAVNHFVSWASDLANVKNKKIYYPKVDKKNLFKDGYIAEKSGHSQAGTVDITLAIPSGMRQPFPLNMGTSFDFFDPRSHTVAKKVSTDAMKNRLLLKMILEKHGFENYDKEWWHFTYKGNPHKGKYFDFDVE